MQEIEDGLAKPMFAPLDGSEHLGLPIGDDKLHEEVCAEHILTAGVARSLHVGEAALLHMKSATALRNELLARIYAQSYTFFEKLVIDLLLAMGYAGGKPEGVHHLGQSHDGGIDAVIHQDALGLDVILLQAKRLRPGHGVSSPQVREFVGSMEAWHSHKGIFVTTGHFTASAQKFLRIIPHRVIMIDGATLADLMIKHNIGTEEDACFVFKRVRNQYFSALRQK
jgi:restriction system protein